MPWHNVARPPEYSSHPPHTTRTFHHFKAGYGACYEKCRRLQSVARTSNGLYTVMREMRRAWRISTTGIVVHQQRFISVQSCTAVD